jgi:hypothetical protein
VVRLFALNEGRGVSLFSHVWSWHKADTQFPKF